MVSVLQSAQRQALIEKVLAEGVNHAGHVLVISVQSIRDRAGERWPMRQESVIEFAEREFGKTFDSSDQFVVLEDARFLLVQANTPPLAAQGRAMNLLREILTFFLGGVSPEDMRISRVTALCDGELQQEPMTRADFEAAETASAMTEAEGAVAVPIEAPVSAKTPRNVPPFDLLFITQPVWSLRKKAIVTYRLKPLIFTNAPDGAPMPTDLSRATTAQIIQIDLCVLDEAFQTFEQSPSGARFGLHVPLHLATLNSTGGSQAVLKRLHAARMETTRRLIIELHGLDDGVPHSVLDKAVSILRPVTLGVVGLARTLGVNPGAWAGSRLSAIAFDLTDVPEPTAGFDLMASLNRFAAAAGRAAGSVIAHSVTTRAEALMAWSSGFTELGGDLFATPHTDQMSSIRFQASDLYRAG
jgi:EAL domain-containing protein (putative c-di-GMP-specific phosphodiesterase class I)